MSLFLTWIVVKVSGLSDLVFKKTRQEARLLTAI